MVNKTGTPFMQVLNGCVQWVSVFHAQPEKIDPRRGAVWSSLGSVGLSRFHT
ncbi:hypothetical protein KSD_20930 [Ktedonobacter sp. SOSP1-85]|nr:hypothetical protein KSD_20930 [Ktedonobacter sp. SOSP1-85]